jgi:nicotinamide-nucleotide amidase
MKLHLLFIGNKFIYNKSLQEYIVRQIEKKTDFINSITYFKESDNSLFLYLEKELNSSDKLLIVTSKQHFSTIGKLICTVTSDNQILKDNMLIPSKVDIFEDGSYLLDYQNSIINVLHVDEMQTMPEILLNFEDSKATIHLFEEDKESALALLSPISQTFDVQVDIVSLIDGWLKIDIISNKYGNINKFITSAKQLLPNKLITTSCIASYIIEKLSLQNKKISFAESCTGGLLTYFFTKNNGSSQILDGSLVTYSNTMKENWLGVNKSTLEEFGAVSYEVVSEMSDGVMNVSNANYTISISGIAGDSGGTVDKPVGTVYIGIRTKKEHKELRLNLNGDRNYVQKQSVLCAIKMLILIDKDIFF